jgi:hypothetical protein
MQVLGLNHKTGPLQTGLDYSANSLQNLELADDKDLARIIKLSHYKCLNQATRLDCYKYLDHKITLLQIVRSDCYK